MSPSSSRPGAHITVGTGVLLLGLGLLAGCGSSTTSSPTLGSTTASTSPSAASPSVSTTPQPAGTPVGPDVSCTDADHCFFRNPGHRSDAQIITHLGTEPGAHSDPAPARKPWPFVVLDAGTTRLDAVDAPSASAHRVGDQYGVLNHRVVFAWCRQDANGHAVSATTAPSSTWYLIDPVGNTDRKRVWFNGAHLHAYLSNGAIPTCS